MLFKTFLEQLFCCEVATNVCNLYKCLIKFLLCVRVKQLLTTNETQTFYTSSMNEAIIQTLMYLSFP